MTFARSLMKTAALAAPLFLAACGAEPMTRGYQLDERALEQIKPGTSAQGVILVLGTPSVVSTVGGKGYYYISQKIAQRYQFMNQSVTDQRVLAVHLDKNNKVERVAQYGIEDGRVFDFISGKTPTGGEDLTFVRQLLRASSFGLPSGLGGGGGAAQPGQ